MSNEKTKLGVTLRLKTPCCGRSVRLNATRTVPRELFTRRCSDCGLTWEVERKTASERPNRRIDIVEWSRPVVRTHIIMEEAS